MIFWMVLTDPKALEDYGREELTELNFDYDKCRQKINNSDDRAETLSVEIFNELDEVERYVLLNFYPIISLIDTRKFLNFPTDNGPANSRVFKINGYPRLYCQSGKTLLHYFEAEESTMVIDKLKKKLEERSSEFRNYDDEEDTEEFEESAYHLLFDETDGKIRTLKDYKEDRFGLSIYLSKKIFASLRHANKVSEESAKKVVKFFQNK